MRRASAAPLLAVVGMPALVTLAFGVLTTLARSPAQAELTPLQGGVGRCDDLDLESLAAALGRLHSLLAQPHRAPLQIGKRAIPAAEYAARTVLPLLDLAGAGDRGRLCNTLARYTWWRESRLPSGKLLFSAYYTPGIAGSRTRDERFRYPLYRRPPGAEATRYDTARILNGALANRGLELVWLEEPYDALALQIEGTAIVRLPDGETMPIGTAGNNGQPYVNVSKLLIADHKLPPGASPATTKPGNPKARAFFAAHPEELARYWGKNPHYVFWKPVDQAGGKFGVLTGGRSIAVDPTIYPLGTIMLLRPGHAFPGGDGTPARLAVSMDTGAAIEGPGRIDVYFGEDEETSSQAVSAGSVEGDAYVLVAP